MNTNTKITIAVVAGFSVGASIGYVVAEKRLKTKYEQIAEQEISDVKDMYEQRRIQDLVKEHNPERKAPPTEEELNKAYSDSILEQKLAPSPETVEKVREIVNYGKYFKQGEEPEDVVVSKDPRPVPSPEFLEADKEINKPYIISVEMYMANDENFDQINLTYYAGDKTLTDDADEIITDVDQTIGIESLARFGQDSGDPNTVYVRNDQREADFEIILDERAFGRDILGMVELEDKLIREPKPRPKRFRDV